MGPVRCDGCGRPVDEEHIRRRITRLELATRYRPIHIGVLFLAEAPPMRLEDYFYCAAKGSRVRAESSRAFFDDLMAACGIPENFREDEEACLVEFQRRGFFLADCAECPPEEIVSDHTESAQQADVAELFRSYGPMVVKRIQYSYKPKHVVLLSMRLRPMVAILEGDGLSESLLLYDGSPLPLAEAGEREERAHFRGALAGFLASISTKARGA